MSQDDGNRHGMDSNVSQPSQLTDEEALRAAQLIQRTFRGHRARRELKGWGLDASTKWVETVKDAQFQDEITKPISGEAQTQNSAEPTPAKKNWTHVLRVASRAAQDDHSSDSSEDEDVYDRANTETTAPNLTGPQQTELDKKRRQAQERSKRKAKMMELQYWLEFVDTKHRHGSNLRKYHAHWKTQDTKENFFYWLDQGGGKHLDLEECSRERLDTQQVRYLTRAERLQYLVQVDDQGLLRWAKNSELVWTKDELYKDSIDGIVPTQDPTPAFQHNIPPPSPPQRSSSPTPSSSSTDSSTTNSSSSSEAHKPTTPTTAPDEGTNYINEDFHRARGPAKLQYLSSGAVFNHMIRTSLQKGHKWIFVCDTSLRLYIGYKQTGAFQHSSFLHGSRILSAGQIKIKHGSLRRLSPLSGHYRPATENFRLFVEALRAMNVDMSRVSISQSYAVLVGLEGYVKSRRKVKSAEGRVKREGLKVVDPERVKREEGLKVDGSESARREREVVEREEMERVRRRRSERAEKREGRKGRVGDWFRRLSLGGSEKGREEKEGQVVGMEREVVRPERGMTGPEDGIPRPG